MNQLLEEKYKELGISEKVYAFGEKIEQELKERFEKIDANAEYNQMKVIAAMQKNRVSAECFNISSGYGYNMPSRRALSCSAYSHSEHLASSWPPARPQARSGAV